MYTYIYMYPTRVLSPWDSPGKNTGVGYHFLLQGIFLTQGLNPSLLYLLHWQVDSFPLSHLGSPKLSISFKFPMQISYSPSSGETEIEEKDQEC